MEFEYDKDTMTKKSFHLRWNNHLQNLQSLFEHLYNEQSLVDVTLSCTDGILYGHKLVLSACSSYFEQVFKDNPCKHPIMILKGIKLHEMKVLLEYMYIGSVDVGEEDLEMLLDTATELQIKGLMRCPDESVLYQSTKADRRHHSSKDSQSAGSPTPSNSLYINDTRWQAELVMTSGSKHKDNDVLSTHENLRHNSVGETVTNNDQMMAQQHEENRTEYEDLFSKKEMNETNMQEDFEEASEDESKEFPVDIKEEPTENLQINYNYQENKISDADDLDYFCHICSRGFQNKGSYHRHMLTHSGIKPHRCTFCEQSFLRLSHLQRHIRVHTGERPYSCGQCPKQFSRSDKLRQHYIIQHNNPGGSKTLKPRGRPRKHLDLYPPSTSGKASTINSMYPVSIKPVTVNKV